MQEESKFAKPPMMEDLEGRLLLSAITPSPDAPVQEYTGPAVHAAMVPGAAPSVFSTQEASAEGDPVPPDPPFTLLGSPLGYVTNSTPISGFGDPDGFGNLMGGDGDPGKPIWYAVTDQGYVHAFDRGNATPLYSVDTGHPGLTGAALTGYSGADPLLTLCAGTNLYKGSITGQTWNETSLQGFATSDFTDNDYAFGHNFGATQSDGINRVDGVELTRIGNGQVRSLDYIEFKLGIFDNPIVQLDGDLFGNCDSMGVPFGSGVLADFGNVFDIEGIAYFDGGFAAIQQPWIDVHAEQPYQQHMQSIPEPATAALLAAGALALLDQHYKKQNGISVADNSEE